MSPPRGTHLKIRILCICRCERDARYLLASIQVSVSLMLSVEMECKEVTLSVPRVDTNALERLPNLSRIHSIKVEHHASANCCAFVGRSGPPSELEVLRIDYYLEAPEQVGRTLSDLGLQLPLPSLEELSFSWFEDCGLDVAAFTGVLENLPTVTSLSLTECPSSFVEALYVSHGSHLCPLLKQLRLDSDSSLDSKRLFEIVESRVSSNRSSTLEDTVFHLTLRECDLVDEEMVSKLEELSVVVDWDER